MKTTYKVILACEQQTYFLVFPVVASLPLRKKIAMVTQLIRLSVSVVINV